jgi:hypothetical protein
MEYSALEYYKSTEYTVCFDLTNLIPFECRYVFVQNSSLRRNVHSHSKTNGPRRNKSHSPFLDSESKVQIHAQTALDKKANEQETKDTRFKNK